MKFPMKLEVARLEFTMKTRRFLAIIAALALAALAYSSAMAHGDADVAGYKITVGFLNEPAYEGEMNAVSVRVVKPMSESESADAGHADHDHSAAAAHSHEETLESEVPIAVSVSAEVADGGGVAVNISADNWRWAPESVDGPREPGAGHAHIYVDGVKIGRVYGPGYDLVGLEPGERHIRVTLNSNDHKLLAVNGEPVEASATVTIPGMAASAGRRMAGIEGLESTLKADITHVASETTRTLELTPLADDPGHYAASIIPTSQGHYRIRLYGEIEGDAIDQTFDSHAGGGEFDDVQAASALQFPLKVASARETESAARGAQANAAAAQEAAASASDSAGGASTLAIAGIALGFLGAAMGGAALAVSLRRGQRDG